MAYNDVTLKRIREVLLEKNVVFQEKKMFSGVCFMVDDKMCTGTHIDKKSGLDYLLCRIGDAAYQAALEMPNCIPMEFTGRSMKGYIFVTEAGFDKKEKLTYWLQLCLDYNPLAKKSKK